MKLKKDSTVYCFFEQSGTFKNAFKKLGFNALDYDILNEFNETDFVLDLFSQIENAFNNEYSIFEYIRPDDLIIAFFPCTRFENQFNMCMRGDNFSMRNKSITDKLYYSLFLSDELNKYYNLFCKLCIVCYERNLRCIIENPYSTQHYLVRYLPLKASFIDFNRRLRGDYFQKPTQYFTINCDLNINFVQDVDIKPKKTIVNTSNIYDRSMISDSYAINFIKEFIL